MLCISFTLFVLITSFSTASEAPSSSANASLLWNPYRPNLYVGFRPRIPNSLLLGVMWAKIDESSKMIESNHDTFASWIVTLTVPHPLDLRHTCEQDEGMAGYGWVMYDARSGGLQLINDTGNNLDLLSYFAKTSDNDWGLRIKGIPWSTKQDQKTAVIVYIGNEDPESKTKCTQEDSEKPSEGDILCGGIAKGLGKFRLHFPSLQDEKKAGTRTSVRSLRVPPDTIWQTKPIFTDKLKTEAARHGMLANDPGEGNLHFIQRNFEGDFEFDILFSHKPNPTAMTTLGLTEAIRDALATFSSRFKSVYHPQSPFADEQHIEFSKSLLSNLIGGIGYFYGTSMVDLSSAPDYAEGDEKHWDAAALARSQAEVKEQGPYQLLSAVPSMPFFPRGFLWDEGFHLQVILRWDMDLALEIVSSWFSLMDESGWIAREQILGPEARSKVPQEFQTQYPHYANPPTIFLVVQAFATALIGEWSYSGAPSRHLSNHTEGRAFLMAILPKLKTNYQWFRRTQAGTLNTYQRPNSPIKEGYRWRGRTPQHVLTSGLDDYPRAQPPHPEELHIDALCWVGAMAMALSKISTVLGYEQDQTVFMEHKTDIIRSLDVIHWSETDQAYCDVTVSGANEMQRVCHKGYISLFPFLVGLMGPDHSHLESILDMMRNPDELWSPFGIRSLSLGDQFYGTGENYWRGPIWININYMALERLLVRG